MKLIVSLFLGLFTISSADDDGEVFSWDSNEDTSASYDGLVIQVYKPDGDDITVTLATDADSHAATYCLTFLRIFEAIGYDLTASYSESSDYEEVDDSSVDLKDTDCTVAEVTDYSFLISCTDINSGTLEFAFSFMSDNIGNEGLEYTIDLEGYHFVSSNDQAQLVLVQSVEDCSSDYTYSADSGETDTLRRRLLDEDTETDTDLDLDDEIDTDDDDETDDAESDDGISSDESGEYDVGFASFIVDGQAVDQCESGDVYINSSLIYNQDDDELHIVFDHFDCTLFIDPTIQLATWKLTDGSNAGSMLIGLVMGFVGFLLF